MNRENMQVYNFILGLYWLYYSIYMQIQAARPAKKTNEIRKNYLDRQKYVTKVSGNSFHHPESSCGTRLPFQDKNDLRMTNFSV